MSAHVLLNLLNELEKRNKIPGLPSSLLLFCNKFNKLNNRIAPMLDSIYYMNFKLFCNHHLKTSRFCHIYTRLLLASFHNVTKICKSLVVYL